MATIYKYRIKCVTDNKFEYVWAETKPTVCPTNTSHTIDQTLTTIVDSIEPSLVKIKEESFPTGEHFQATTLKLDINPNSCCTNKISWPYSVSALSVNFVTSSEHTGDILDMYVGKDTITGYIMADIEPANYWSTQNYMMGNVVKYSHPTFGDRVYTCISNTVSNNIPTDTIYWKHGYEIPVSNTVAENVSRGFYLKVTDLTNADDLGRVLDYDKITNKVWVEQSPINSFSMTSPSYIQQTVYIIKDFEIGEAWDRVIGESKIGGSHIPADTFVEVMYTNISGNAKSMIGHVEYLY